MSNRKPYDNNDTRHSSFWQVLEYRKRLKTLIERGLSVNELHKQSKKLFKELNDE